jgi:hypothetical protein
MPVLVLVMGQRFVAAANLLTMEQGHAAGQQRCSRRATPALCQTSEAVAFLSHRQEAVPTVLPVAGTG